MNKKSSHLFRITNYSWAISLFLFILALTPRLPGLGRFITSDEPSNTTGYISRTIEAFLAGEFRDTYWHFYPGVTMSWLNGFGLGGQYLLDLLVGANPLPFTEYIYQDLTTFLIAVRLPYVLLTALFVPLVYWLTRQLLPQPIALFGALLLAFDPFFLAHSRVVHGDAPVAVFMTISVLALFIFFERNNANRDLQINRGVFILSAICGGLAALTKAPGQFMALFLIGLTMLYGVIDWCNGATIKRTTINNLKIIVAWGLLSLATFIILWPSMWVAPFDTIQQMLDETFGKVNEGHLVYFFGQPMLDPGPWFYAYVIPFRLTPLTAIGALLAFIGLIITSRRPVSDHVTGIPLISIRLMWLFVVSLFLFGNLSPKKQDRYLLPLFPMLDLLAAVGWSGLLGLGLKSLPQRFQYKFMLPVGMVLIFVAHSLPVVTYYPYYLAYFNPLMGGPTRAAETVLMGWGEGMEQAAAYLNQKPNAEQLYVASTPSQTFLPYFEGTGENFYTNDIPFRSDYVVLYLAQMQRLAPSPEIIRYFQNQEPEHVITIQEVPYIKIYAHEKRILADIPASATPMNIGLGNLFRLAGYEHHDKELILYWHALTSLETDYTISVRVLSADGMRLVQHDSWPLQGLLPTSTWRQGDYVADVHLIGLSGSQLEQIAEFELVIYQSETGETLGPPITIQN
ncbi:phospholipid carrier-dependent glycosyltransferase [Anaerolineales bacterium HSG6]|nr:phospholipid carrier-dependent glycosyltransferase [Anaerolineales bacterium HSG6]